MIRVALAGVELQAKRDILFEVVDAPECDYLFTTDRCTSIDPRHTLVLDAGDVLGALFDGATETRSTMSLLDGPVFLVSAPFPVPPLVEHARARGDAETIETYAALHRKWMIEASFTSMVEKAIEFLAAGELQIVGDVVWIDGVPGPCRMGDAPSFCREAEKSGVPVTCPFIAT
ncbi:MAG TPA: hypothetical protein VJ901_02405 [Thermoanaerobaculia bacterium]|nr:hypothetical protein [Thermoanaerobaculia bacterium]